MIKLHEFLWFDVLTIKTTQNNESDQITMNLHRFDVKNFKTTQNCKSNQITMNYIYITSKWSKMLLCRKTFQTPENYKSDQIGRQNEQNVELRRKPFKTAKLQKWSKYNDLHRFEVKSNHITMNLHRFDVKTNYNVELRRKTF